MKLKEVQALGNWTLVAVNASSYGMATPMVLIDVDRPYRYDRWARTRFRGNGEDYATGFTPEHATWRGECVAVAKRAREVHPDDIENTKREERRYVDVWRPELVTLASIKGEYEAYRELEKRRQEATSRSRRAEADRTEAYRRQAEALEAQLRTLEPSLHLWPDSTGRVNVSLSLLQTLADKAGCKVET
jgi:hypothetical protein